MVVGNVNFETVFGLDDCGFGLKKSRWQIEAESWSSPLAGFRSPSLARLDLVKNCTAIWVVAG